MTIRIVTDSACDIPLNTQLDNVDIMNFHINMVFPSIKKQSISLFLISARIMSSIDVNCENTKILLTRRADGG